MRKPEVRGEARRPEHAHGIFPEPGLGLTHGTDELPGQVPAALERVEQPVFSHIVCHGVDGEVAERQVSSDRASMVTEGGDLIGAAVVDHGHCSVFEGEAPAVAEQRGHTIGRGRGGHVPVGRLQVEQCISQRAAPRCRPGARPGEVSKESTARRPVYARRGLSEQGVCTWDGIARNGVTSHSCRGTVARRICYEEA